jgi:hypothetical protein
VWVVPGSGPVFPQQPLGERERDRERWQTSDWRQQGGCAPASIARPRLGLPSQQIASNTDFLHAASCQSLVKPPAAGFHTEPNNSAGTVNGRPGFDSWQGQCSYLVGFQCFLYIHTASETHTPSYPMVNGNYLSVIQQTEREAGH